MNESLYLITFRGCAFLTCNISMPSQTHGPMSLLPKCWFLCLIEVSPPPPGLQVLGCYCTGGGRRLKEHGEAPTLTGV